MKVTVKLFAGAAQAAGMRSIDIELADGANVAAARGVLLEHLPQLRALCAVSLWATETEMLDESAVLRPYSELAMIPPVSGG